MLKLLGLVLLVNTLPRSEAWSTPQVCWIIPFSSAESCSTCRASILICMSQAPPPARHMASDPLSTPACRGSVRSSAAHSRSSTGRVAADRVPRALRPSRTLSTCHRRAASNQRRQKSSVRAPAQLAMTRSNSISPVRCPYRLLCRHLNATVKQAMRQPVQALCQGTPSRHLKHTLQHPTCVCLAHCRAPSGTTVLCESAAAATC